MDASTERDRAAFAREFGLRLQRARDAAGLTQEELAHRAGISSYTYFKFEKGESKPGTPANPRLFTLIALAQALHVELDVLIPANPPDLRP